MFMGEWDGSRLLKSLGKTHSQRFAHSVWTQ